MTKNGTGESFITLKDHKDDFNNAPKTRLINPAKNEIGRISKNLLDDINQQLRNILKINQWKNTWNQWKKKCRGLVQKLAEQEKIEVRCL